MILRVVLQRELVEGLLLQQVEQRQLDAHETRGGHGVAHAQAYDARAADLNAERTKAGVVAAKAKRVHIQDPKTKKWKRKSSCEKADAPDVTEDVGVEEEKGGEPAPPSPPPRALQDHNDNEETKDEAKAKVKKTPAKKGYVSARVKKIEGKE